MAALDRELAATLTTCTRAALPPGLVFEAVGRFAESMERELGLVMCQEKLLCFSHNVVLAACPERAAHGGFLERRGRRVAAGAVWAEYGPSGVPREVVGITCGGGCL